MGFKLFKFKGELNEAKNKEASPSFFCRLAVSWYLFLIIFFVVLESKSLDKEGCINSLSQFEQLEKSESSLEANESLKLFIERGNVREIMKVIENNMININTQDAKENTALMKVVQFGNLDDILIIFDQPFLNVNSQNSLGKTALMLAIEWERIDMVKLLLMHPFTRLDLVDTNDKTALILAIELYKQSPQFYYQVVKLLLNPKLAAEFWGTADKRIREVFDRKSIKLTKDVNRNNALNFQDNLNETATMKAITIAQDTKLVELLLSYEH